MQSRIAALAVSILALAAPTLALAATTPSFGTAASYVVLARTLTSTTIPYGANVYGDVGYATTTGVIIGMNALPHVADAAFTQAGTDQHAALAALDAQACTFTFPGAVDLATDTTHGTLGVYTPGVYCAAGNMTIGNSGTINLDGAGTFIFRPTGLLSTSDMSIATTTGSASACDVFWTPKGMGVNTLGLDSRFVGTMITPVGPANSDIAVAAGTRWAGRALSYDWTVTTNPVILKYINITAPTCPVPPIVPPVVPPVEPPVVIPPVVIPPVTVPPTVVPPVVPPVNVVSVVDPKTPNTGKGGDAQKIVIVLALSALIAAAGSRYLLTKRARF